MMVSVVLVENTLIGAFPSAVVAGLKTGATTAKQRSRQDAAVRKNNMQDG